MRVTERSPAAPKHHRVEGDTHKRQNDQVRGRRSFGVEWSRGRSRLVRAVVCDCRDEVNGVYTVAPDGSEKENRYDDGIIAPLADYVVH